MPLAVKKSPEHDTFEPGVRVYSAMVKHSKCLGMACFDPRILDFPTDDPKLKTNLLLTTLITRRKQVQFCTGYFREIFFGEATCHTIEEIHRMHRRAIRDHNYWKLGWRIAPNFTYQAYLYSQWKKEK